jgi:hypothetical protein
MSPRQRRGNLRSPLVLGNSPEASGRDSATKLVTLRKLREGILDGVDPVLLERTALKRNCEP